MSLLSTFRPLSLALAACAAAAAAHAAPVRYDIDPAHTYPSFEADHGGLSVWRGKFNKSSGTVELDQAARQGTVDITIDTRSIDFGDDKLNEHAQGAQLFDTAQYPTATYKGHFANFAGGAPREIRGEFTLRGVTRPLRLQIVSFKCVKQHPINKRETCGADARGTFNRHDFGVDMGLDMGFKPEVQLRIQAEAIRAD